MAKRSAVKSKPKAKPARAAAKKSTTKPAAKAKKSARPAAKKSAAKPAKKPVPKPKKPATTAAAKSPAATKPAARSAATKPTKPAEASATPATIAKAAPTSSERAPAGANGPAVTRDQLLDTLAEIAPRLAADPLYSNEANAPFDAAELERYFATVFEGATLGDLFGEILQGMIQSVRYSALHIVRALFRDDGQATITTKPALQIAQGDTLAVVGDLIVEGDLDNEGVLVVTGDLTVRGAYVGPAFDYSLAAIGGTFRARDVSTSGEILVGDRLEADRVVHLLYNDYSSIIPTLKARALVIDDNFPALGAVEAELQIHDTPSDEQLRAMFGAAAEQLSDEDEAPIRTLIRS